MLIMLEPEEFDALVEALERTPKDMPKLRELLEMESPFAEDARADK